MTLFAWWSRRVGGLSILALVVFSYFVITREAAATPYGHRLEQSETPLPAAAPSKFGSGAGIWTYVFAYYSFFVHITLFMFTVRSCWAIWDVTTALKQTIGQKDYGIAKVLSETKRNSQDTLSSLTSIVSESSAAVVSESDDSKTLCESPRNDSNFTKQPVIHAIIIPNYKEEFDTLKETLEVLASHPEAASSYDVYLGMEQRERSAESKALRLIQIFVKKFRFIDYTLHPKDIPGESAGKGSNLAWAARKLSARYSFSQRESVIVTGIDSDSHLLSSYFSLLTDMHLAHPETATSTLYAAPLIFDRNANNVPSLVRTADIMWAAAGMSGLYRGSVISPPTSVYSVPLFLVDRIGGWDADADAIGEDLHMYIKCFFALNGNLTTRTIFSPVSHSNVTAGRGNSLKGAVMDIVARYNQALRHMWGALDTGFAIRQGVRLWEQRKIKVQLFRPLHQSPTGESSDIYFPEMQDGEIPPPSRENEVFTDVTRAMINEPHWANIFYLYHRMFEAHLLPVQIAILVIASALYVWVTEGKDDPHHLDWMFLTTSVLRAVSFMLGSCYLVLYETYHRLAMDARERELTLAGMSFDISGARRSIRKNFMDFLVVPIIAPLYGTIPAAQALLAQLWTQNLTYTVSKKALRQQPRPRLPADLV